MHTTHQSALPWGIAPASRQVPRHVPRHRAERPSRAAGSGVRRLAAGAVTGLALSGTVATLAPPAPASAESFGGQDRYRDARQQEREQARREAPSPVSSRVVGIAASKAGTPYGYGASGPDAFDCSGFTSWVYARAGTTLPRTSSAQAGAVDRIAAGDARPGDLVFFTGGGGVYHVGIYAGGNSVWHAPRPGQGVRREAIWTSSVFYGRVR